MQLNEDPRGATAPLFHGEDLVVRGIARALAVVGGICILAGAALAIWLELGRPVYGMGMLFIGMLILLAVASLAKGLISSGINLVALALGKSFGRTNR